MVEPDPPTLLKAAARYRRLRRCYWRSFLAMPVLLSLMWLAGVLKGTPERAWFGPFIILVAGAFVLCWLVGFLTGSYPRNFRCPRCGGRFILTWWSSWPTDRCKHCDLDLGLSTTANKPPVDDWSR